MNTVRLKQCIGITSQHSIIADRCQFCHSARKSNAGCRPIHNDSRFRRRFVLRDAEAQTYCSPRRRQRRSPSLSQLPPAAQTNRCGRVVSELIQQSSFCNKVATTRWFSLRCDCGKGGKEEKATEEGLNGQRREWEIPTSSGFSAQRCSMSTGKPAPFHCSTSGSAEVVPSDSDVPSHIARSAAASSGLAEACTPLSEPLGCEGRPRLSQRCIMSDRRLPTPVTGSTGNAQLCPTG